MKKIIIILFALTPVLYFTACKKKYTTDNVTEKIVEPHYPVITLSNPQFISIKPGESLPSISATAYDSVAKESCEMFPIDVSGVNNTRLGLYPVDVKSRNTDGFITTKNVYIAVTMVPDSADLSGLYERTANGVEVNVTEVANGLYATDNFFGSTPGYAYFAHINDSTIDLPTQTTEFGTLVSEDAFLSLGADTVYGYKLFGVTSNNVLRSFKKIQ